MKLYLTKFTVSFSFSFLLPFPKFLHSQNGASAITPLFRSCITRAAAMLTPEICSEIVKSELLAGWTEVSIYGTADEQWLGAWALGQFSLRLGCICCQR